MTENKNKKSPVATNSTPVDNDDLVDCETTQAFCLVIYMALCSTWPHGALSKTDLKKNILNLLRLIKHNKWLYFIVLINTKETMHKAKLSQNIKYISQLGLQDRLARGKLFFPHVYRHSWAFPCFFSASHMNLLFLQIHIFFQQCRVSLPPALIASQSPPRPQMRSPPKPPGQRSSRQYNTDTKHLSVGHDFKLLLWASPIVPHPRRSLLLSDDEEDTKRVVRSAKDKRLVWFDF